MIKLDDSQPDYFIDDDSDQASRHEDSDPRTITFGDQTSTGSSDDGRKPRLGRMRKLLLWAVGIAVLFLCIGFYLRYLNPYVTDARVRGYVTAIEKRGIIFKTYEADLISEAALTDTTRLYSNNLSLSVDDPTLIARLQSLQGSGRPVTIVYETYYATLPWRGASHSVITSILSSDDDSGSAQTDSIDYTNQ